MLKCCRLVGIVCCLIDLFGQVLVVHSHLRQHIFVLTDSLNASIAIVVGFNVTIDHSNTHVVKLCQLVKGKSYVSYALKFFYMVVIGLMETFTTPNSSSFGHHL